MLKSLFSSNERMLKKVKKRVSHINKIHEQIKSLSDEDLKDRFAKLKHPSLEEVFAIVKEATKRTLGFDTYDVQLMGGIILSEGNIPEMKTGEGKTLVAVAPAVYESFYGKVHVVTVNDYLADRDANIMKPIYDFLGLSLGIITHNPMINKKEEYSKDIVYVTNTELAFDYLRDNLAMDKELQVLPSFDFAIIDEVDSILIDDARSPLIISGNVQNDMSTLYKKVNEICLKLEKGEEIKDKKGQVEKVTGDFYLDLKKKTAILNDSGIEKIESQLEVGNLFEGDDNVVAFHAANQALAALYCYEKDVDYIIREGEVFIIDENTGRVSEGRRFGEGLHQAIEVKEGLEPQAETQTIANTSYQNFFKKYKKLSGMTGTAQTEATEFAEIYDLDVITVPTNKPLQRKDLKDVIYFSEEEKIEAILEKVKGIHETGQPILIGTASIEKSELFEKHFNSFGFKVNVLNAKNHAKEAEIIEAAGQKGAITIATNMAGRGVDIKVPEECLQLGGLYIIGTERHISRRIDNQLRGRSGRQGDVGTTQFYLSLDDELVTKFGGDKVKSIAKALKVERGESIQSGILTKSVEKAQKQIEEMHYEYRKNVVKFDDVNNDQRNVIYDIRQKILDKEYHIDEKTDEYFKEVSSSILTELNMAADFDIKKEKELLIKYFSENYYIDIKEAIENIEDENYSENKEVICASIMMNVLNQKREEVGMPQEELSQIKRVILLQQVDKEWREHLYQLDVLSTGIGLRQYNQKDPVIEYKKEAYHMFENLISRIKVEYITYLNKVTFSKNEET